MNYVVPSEFHPVFEGLAFRCAAPGFDIGPSLLDRHANLVRHFGGLRMMLHLFVNLLGPHLDEMFEAVDAEVASADVVITSQLASTVTAVACERRGVPMILGDVFPMHVPSAFTPPQGAPQPRTSDQLPHLGGRTTPDAHGTTGRPSDSGLPKPLGLRPDGWSLARHRCCPHPRPRIAALRRPPARLAIDLPTRGFSAWSGPKDRGLSDEVVEFLDAGPPPIVVTQVRGRVDAHRLLRLPLARGGRRRPVRPPHLQPAERNALRSRIPGGRHAIWPFVPLGALLERSRGAIHAGGFGTTALTVTAGVPSAISPCFNDSYWQARRHEELGIGIRIRGRNLRAAVNDSSPTMTSMTEPARWASGSPTKTGHGTVATRWRPS